MEHGYPIKTLHGGPATGVISDLPEALADTTELTDRVYLVFGCRFGPNSTHDQLSIVLEFRHIDWNEDTWARFILNKMRQSGIC